MMRFADNTFNPGFISTIGVDFRFRTMTVEDKVVKLQIWDTAGQEKFRTITSSYYRNAHAVMIVYDVGAYSSFQSIDQWLRDIEQFCPESVCRQMIGNKCDIPPEAREVSEVEGREFAEREGIRFLETSAKTAENVEAAFREMVRELIANKIRAQSTEYVDVDLAGHGAQSRGCGGYRCQIM